MNEKKALEEEMRLKKETKAVEERWLVEEQMLHFQERHKTRMKEEQKCLPEGRCKRMNEQNQLLNEETTCRCGEKKGLSNAPLISAEDETHEGKGETPVDVIKDKAKGDVDPVILI
ncbi:hypothetical protein TNCV_4156671 [Trichonephila clavipes]|nr:hypothetical protein TNCV_4156671 [Trichonephila clavipes]